MAVLPGRSVSPQRGTAHVSRQPSARRSVYAFTAPCRALLVFASFFSGGVHYRALDCLSVLALRLFQYNS
ncbi:unnamed protein product [Acanthoscelides obtectus]|uniref:Uncharacterized protein n=1 Tax=Acanthoscelides obtectus TaxID=200917 RepID=A0A9P0KTT5_ACAOB|nr:unnamed protein product [Acanthoscelides obtectus]CAK1659083.1 hypothetical protein AOBTE_LOCUS21270 [Acanthoscelides obtectus]